jgi:hypothetical protein
MALNLRAKVDSQLEIARKLIALDAANNAGDCDGDGFIEPAPPDTGAGCNITLPGGGCIPSNVGAAKTDPWGTMVGYCAWNHGPLTSGHGCPAGLLTGTNGTSKTVIAVISAGADRQFQSTCGNDPAYVTKGGDDIVDQWTFSEAQTLSGGGLWTLMSGNPNAITTSKNVDIANNSTFASGTTATFQGNADFGAGSKLSLASGALLNLPTQVQLPDAMCAGASAAANDGVLRVNTSTGRVLQICDPTALPSATWVSIGGSNTVTKLDDLSDAVSDFATGGNLFLGNGGGNLIVAGSAADNVAVGVNAGAGMTTGTKNLLLGYNAGHVITTGSNNIIINPAATDSTALATTSNLLDIGSLIYGVLPAPGGGAVGIGTATPGALLDVNGSLKAGSAAISGALSAASAGISGAATVGGTFGATGATTLGSTLSVAGNVSSPGGTVDITSGLDTTGVATFENTVTVTGATTLNNSLTVAGLATLNSDLAVLGHAQITGAVGGLSYELGLIGSGVGLLPDAANLKLKTTGGLIEVLTGGNVGIGVANPQTELDVNGPIKIGQTGAGCTAPIYGAIRYSSTDDKFQICSKDGSWETVGTSGGGGGGGGSTSAAGTAGDVQYNSGGIMGASGNFVYTSAGRLGVGTGTPGARLQVSGGDFLNSGSYTGAASVPASGAGARMFYDVGSAAFRAGTVTGTDWDNGSIGNYSTAFGLDNTASGAEAMAWGNAVTVSGINSTAWGQNTVASGNYSTALGSYVMVGNGVPGANGNNSLAIGLTGVNTPVSAAVTGNGAFGIFMQDQHGKVLAANNTMGLFGGRLVIDPNTQATLLAPNANTDMDVNGNIGSVNYCDVNGNNCFTASQVAGGATGAPGSDRDVVFNSGGKLGAYPTFVFTSAGRLGVGTVTPTTARLVVQGATADNTSAALNVTNATPASLLYVRNDGNVGIGTAGPSYLLSLGSIAKGFAEYSSASGLDAIKAVANNAGAAFGVQNLNASGFAGIEYIGSDGNVTVFTGYNNGNPGEFRFNNIATSGFITFKIAGSDKLTIANSGLVGVGTTTPYTKLEVAGTVKVGDGAETCNSVNYAGGIRYTSAKSIQYCDGTAWQTLASSGSGGVTAAGVQGNVQYNSGGKLAANANFTFTSAGRLGIGTTAPTNSLSVVGGSINVTNNQNGATEVQIMNSTNGTSATSRLLLNAGGSQDIIGSTAPGYTALSQLDNSLFMRTGGGHSINFVTSDAQPIEFYTNNTERVRIDSIGNVGIGTTSPIAKLEATASTSGAFPITASDSGLNNGDWFGIGLRGYTGGSGSIKSAIVKVRNGTFSVGDIAFLNNSTADDSNAALSDEKMRITSAGNVGIGTTSPAAPLDVMGNDTSGVTGIRLGVTANANNFGVGTQGISMNRITGSNASMYISTVNAGTWGGGALAGAIQLSPNNAPAMTLLTTGLVGIGTTGPATKLDVAGTARVADGGETCGVNYKGGIRYTSANILQYCNSTSWQTLVSGSGGAVAWNAITNPTGNQSLTMNHNTSLFTYDATTGANDLFKLIDTASNTGTGYLLNVSTASGSHVNPLHLSAQGTTDLVFTSAGRLGIGTASPAAKLEVDSSLTGSSGIEYGVKILPTINASATEGYTALLVNATETATGSGAKYLMDLQAGGSPKFRVDDTGAIWSDSGNFYYNPVGHILNTYDLQAVRTVGAPYFALNGWATIIDNPSGGNVRFAPAASWTSIGFFTSGTDRLHIDTNGWVGIGTTTTVANTLLDVNGNVGAVQYCDVNGNNCFVPGSGGTVAAAGSTEQVQFNSGGVLGADANFNWDRVNGRLGIGTAAPSQKLQIAGVTPSATSWQMLGLTSTDAVAANIGGSIGFGGYFTGTTLTAWGFIRGLKENATDGDRSGYLAFGTRVNGSYPAERMRIDSTGNIGIGTTAPGAYLHINPTQTVTTDTTMLKSGIVYNGGSAMTNWYGAYVAAPTGSGTITNKYALVTEAGAGNVGIGTATPGAALHVNGNGIFGGASVSLTSGTGLQVASTQVLELDSNNSVVADFGFGQLVLTNHQFGTANIVGSLPFVNAGLATAEKRIAQINGVTSGATNSGALTFSTNNAGTFAERMRIDNAGNVGIGTTSPAELLDVNGRLHLAQTTAPVTTTGKLYNVAGTLYWNGTALGGGGGMPAGANKQIQYNNSGAFGASANFNWDTTTSSLALGGGTTPSYGISFTPLGGTPATIGMEMSSWLGIGLTISAGAANTGGYTDIPGGYLILKGGDATGAGSSGIRFMTAVTAASGTSANPAVEVMRIAGANVGIGTASPAGASLVVGTSTAASGNNTSGIAVGRAYADPTQISNYGNLYLFSTDSEAVDKGGVVSLGAAYTGTLDARLAALKGAKENGTDGQYGGYLALYTRTNGASGPAERMRIDSSGNVGIGTATPAQRLSLYNASGNVYMGFTSSNTTYGSTIGLNGVSLQILNSDPGFGSPIYFYNNALMALSLISGNVGIGTASPAELLDVAGRVHVAQTTAPVTTTDKLYNVGGTLYWNGTALGGGGSQTPWTSNTNAAGYTLDGNSTASGNLTLDSTSNATKGYVLLNPAGGNVGIGTATPGGNLAITAAPTLTIAAGNNNLYYDYINNYNPALTLNDATNATTRPSFIAASDVVTLNAVAIGGGGFLSSKHIYSFYGSQANLVGSPTINTTGGLFGNFYGIYGSSALTPTLTAVGGNDTFNDYAGYFTNSSTSPGNANLTYNSYGISVNNTSNLGTAGATTAYGANITNNANAATGYGAHIFNNPTGGNATSYGAYIANYSISGSTESYGAYIAGGQNSTNNYALYVAGGGFSGFGGTHYGLYVNQQSGLAGSAEPAYGIYLTGPVWGGSDYALYSNATAPSYFAGNVGIGTASPNAKLTVSGGGISTGAAGNTDLAGQLTLTAGTRSFTFTGVYTGAPVCVASDTAASPVAAQVTTTATTLTLTVPGGTNTDTFNYICLGRN